MSEWIEWKGGACPVKSSDHVELEWADGVITRGDLADLVRWDGVKRYRVAPAHRSEANLTPEDTRPQAYTGFANTMTPEELGAAVVGTPGYEPLAAVLQRAYEQAAGGKGKEHRAQGKPFLEQPMQELISLYGLGFALGQAGKKAQESQRLPRDKAVHELLGAIVYLAGAVVALEAERGGRSV